MRTALVRSAVQRLLNQRPFRPFALLLENGDRVIIEHPENIAFDPVAQGPGTFTSLAADYGSSAPSRQSRT